MILKELFSRPIETEEGLADVLLKPSEEETPAEELPPEPESSQVDLT